MMIEKKDIYPSIEGAKSINRMKNRYKDVLPCKFDRWIFVRERRQTMIQMINIVWYFNRVECRIISMPRLSR